MNIMENTNFTVNRNVSKITGLVSQKEVDNNVFSYYILKSSRPKVCITYESFLVFLYELGYGTSKLYNTILSKRKALVERDMFNNKLSASRRDIKYKQVEVIVDQDGIKEQMDRTISLMKSGITLEDGSKRPFDYLDYYQKIGLRPQIFNTYINGSKLDDFKSVFAGFIKKYNYNYELDLEKVKSLLSFDLKRNVEFDEKGNQIPGTGVVVGKKNQSIAYHYSFISDMPFCKASYDSAIDRLLLGCLDGDLIEELYYKKKIEEVEYVMMTLGSVDKANDKLLKTILNTVKEKAEYYSEKNKNRYKTYLDGLVKNKELDVNNPYHMAVGNLYMRYCQDTEIVKDYPEEIIDRDNRTVIEKESYEYRPIVIEKCSDKRIGQKI